MSTSEFASTLTSGLCLRLPLRLRLLFPQHLFHSYQWDSRLFLNNLFTIGNHRSYRNRQDYSHYNRRSPYLTSDPQINAAATDPSTPPAFGFSGIFFGGLFGGHNASWATLRDQYMRFKDFALAVNN